MFEAVRDPNWEDRFAALGMVCRRTVGIKRHRWRVTAVAAIHARCSSAIPAGERLNATLALRGKELERQSLQRSVLNHTGSCIAAEILTSRFRHNSGARSCDDAFVGAA